MIKLHGLNVSGNTYKAKLLMSLMGIDYKFHTLDILNQQHKSATFLTLNPRGEFPVLEDDKLVIWDSQAILVYLAKQYASSEQQHWYPENPADMAHITQWLTVANNEIFSTLAKARAILKLGHNGDLADCQKKAKTLLQWFDQHLSHRQWLVTEQPTIADIACYPYIALCEEGEISLLEHLAIQCWFKRIESLHGYIQLPE